MISRKQYLAQLKKQRKALAAIAKKIEQMACDWGDVDESNATTLDDLAAEVLKVMRDIEMPAEYMQESTD